MSEPIKIVVTAQTAEAAAALQAFVKNTGDGLKQVTKAGEESEGALSKNRIALLELGHVGRATAEGLAAGINPLRVLALESPRILQALSFMGIGLAALAPYAVAAGATAAAGYVGWKLYMAGVEDTTKANEELVKSLDKVPAILEKINKQQKAGVISPAAAAEFADYLGQNPKKKLYVQPDGTISPNAAETTRQPNSTRPWLTDTVTKNLVQATPGQANDWVLEEGLKKPPIHKRKLRSSMARPPGK